MTLGAVDSSATASTSIRRSRSCARTGWRAVVPVCLHGRKSLSLWTPSSARAHAELAQSRQSLRISTNTSAGRRSAHRTMLRCSIALKRDFPTDSFLIVRFGDHQPEFAHRIIDPSMSEAALARQLEAFDPRYFTSYYAIDAVNFKPAIFIGADRWMRPICRCWCRKPPAAARSVLRRAKEDSATLPRLFYSCAGARGAPLQPPAVRGRADQGTAAGCVPTSAG